jgi:hypothetical protein
MLRSLFFCDFVGNQCFAQPKKSLVTPPPQFGNESKHLRELMCISEREAHARLYILLQFYNFQASLNHRANACSGFFYVQIGVHTYLQNNAPSPCKA